MNREELFTALGSLRQANFSGGGRSPYKPLLILWVLGQLRAGKENQFLYEEVESSVTQLIDEFSPASTTSYRAHLPFFHLEKELWELSGEGKLEAKRNVLRSQKAVGRLRPEIVDLLKSEEGLIEEVARFLVESQFTDSYLEPIFNAVGLDAGVALVGSYGVSIDQKKRDPKFRNAVLIAWRKQCAMCGFDGELSSSSVGLEAAHVKWFSQGGPDDLDNGLALCELHHALFDLGVLGISQSHRIQVADAFVGKSDASKRLVYDLHDRELLEPAPNRPMPSLDFIDWHSREVFKKIAS